MGGIAFILANSLQEAQELLINKCRDIYDNGVISRFKMTFGEYIKDLQLTKIIDLNDQKIIYNYDGDY